MKKFIIDFDSSDALSPALVGGKASNLAHLKLHSIRVPRGFCVTTRAYRESPKIFGNAEFNQLLSSGFKRLMSSKGVSSLIVRSSATLEDSAQAAFPGIFVSTPDVLTVDELIQAIQKCFGALSSKRAISYCKLAGVDHRKIQMAALIQEYLKPLYAGVCLPETDQYDSKLSGIYVELRHGSSFGMLKGELPPEAYLLRGSPKNPRILALTKKGTKKLTVSARNVLKRLGPTVEEINLVTAGPQVVEWVATAKVINVVQTRPLSEVKDSAQVRETRLNPIRRTENELRLKSIRKLGVKGAAMKFFGDIGWFTKSLILASSDESVGMFCRRLERSHFGNQGLTIRFSYKGEIGLPRFFARSKDEARLIVENHRQPKWTIIIHDYITVRHSYEIFVDNDKVYLEHVPGMWESGSAIAPDALMGGSDSWVALRVPKRRMATLVTPRRKTRFTSVPVSMDTLYYWKAKLSQVAKRIRSEFGVALPLILHCVSEADGDWQFLNIRRSGTLQDNVGSNRRFHIVTGLKDLETWDRKRPILLRIATDRGAEDSLVDLAAELPRDSNRVFIDFGALSHPAIMLRELGINPRPVYLTHERIELNE